MVARAEPAGRRCFGQSADGERARCARRCRAGIRYRTARLCARRAPFLRRRSRACGAGRGCAARAVHRRTFQLRDTASAGRAAHDPCRIRHRRVFDLGESGRRRVQGGRRTEQYVQLLRGVRALLQVAGRQRSRGDGERRRSAAASLAGCGRDWTDHRAGRVRHVHAERRGRLYRSDRPARFQDGRHHSDSRRWRRRRDARCEPGRSADRHRRDPDARARREDFRVRRAVRRQREFPGRVQRDDRRWRRHHQQ